MKLVIYTDGASRGNPGPASYGFIVLDEKGKLLREEGEYIGQTTNNVAEYTAVLKALEWIKKKYNDRVEISMFADSKLVAEQLSGRYKIKSPHLKLLIEKIRNLSFDFEDITFSHIPREKNTKADKLANQALDQLI